MRKKPAEAQTAVFTTGYVVFYFAQWLISVLLVRLGGYTAAGIFALAMTVSNVFAYFSNYGTRGFQITDYAKKYSDRQYILHRAETILVSVIFCVIYLLAMRVYTPEEKWAILLYLLYSAVNTLGDVLMGAVQIRGRLEINGYSNILRGVLSFLVFVAGYAVSGSMVTALLLMAIAAAAVFLGYDVRQYHAVVGEKSALCGADFRQSLSLWKDCFSLMLALMIPIITTAIPRQSIRVAFGSEVLGYYASVFTPTVIIPVLVSSVVTAQMPALSDCWNTGDSMRFRRTIRRFIGAFALLAAVACLTAFLLGKPVMSLIFGNEILDYFDLLYYAILATVISSMGSFFSSVLTAMRRTKVIAFSAAAAMAITAASVRIFLRKFGVYGAAYSHILAYSAQCVLLFVCIHVEIRKEFFHG